MRSLWLAMRVRGPASGIPIAALSSGQFNGPDHWEDRNAKNDYGDRDDYRFSTCSV